MQSQEIKVLLIQDFWGNNWGAFECLFLATDRETGNVVLNDGGPSGVQGKECLKPRNACLAWLYCSIFERWNRNVVMYIVKKGLNLLTIEDLPMKITVVGECVGERNILAQNFVRKDLWNHMVRFTHKGPAQHASRYSTSIELSMEVRPT